jgi:CD109 antigen
MRKRVSRRAFLAGSAAMASSVACVGLPSAPVGTGPAATSVPLVDDGANGYLAVAPRALRSGQMEAVAISLFKGGQPARGRVTVTLRDKAGTSLLEETGWIGGHGLVPLRVPAITEGEYQLALRGAAFRDQSTVRVEDGLVLFLETDKPVYKPGQTLQMRLLALDPTLRPATGEAVVEVMDGQGAKVFKKTVTIDETGMAALELPLSTEPNLGTWKLKATSGKRTAQRDVRVERYVLPKYEVKVELAREWALVGEPVAGTVSAEYGFGKAVAGEVEIVAFRSAGGWQEYARVTRPLDGNVAFEVPPARTAAPAAAGGAPSLRLDVTVREQATGYSEQTSRMVPVATMPVTLRLVPEGATFKPGLPFSLLISTETPDKKPVDTDVQLRLAFVGADFAPVKDETGRVTTKGGLAIFRVTPPAKAAALTLQATANKAVAAMTYLSASHSPSESFVQIEPVTRGRPRAGDMAEFKVWATGEASDLCYEVLARGKVVLADLARTGEIAFRVTPLMAPEARLLVYRVLPSGEVAADHLPFTVESSFPQEISVSFDKGEVKPGEAVEVRVQGEGAARVGLAAVDRSLYVLSDNRLNLAQVSAELARAFASGATDEKPAGPPNGFSEWTLPGAKEAFQSAGVSLLTNRYAPAGRTLSPRAVMMERGGGPVLAAGAAAPAAGVAPMAAPLPAATAAVAQDQAAKAGEASLAEPERLRQFFPETWVWTDLTTNGEGRGSKALTAPDSIATWAFRAVSLSKDRGLGIGEAELKVFQSLFVQVDLPYAAVRGEEFPARIALYNYQASAEEFTVALEAGAGIELLEAPEQRLRVEANSVGAASFRIRPAELGVRTLKVIARGRSAADALVKELLVEPEGVAREEVENFVLPAGGARTLALAAPAGVVAGSGRAQIAVSGSVLSQTIDGLEGLLQMSFGCGEQNMVLFAPNVFIARYLKESGQARPEVMAKAERLMLTGYQRELTYRRSDGSFSAFGQGDPVGSLWLTAFVMRTFAQARDLIHIDESVLAAAGGWIRQQQKGDGSFEPVGFLHHQGLMGGLSGKTALTAYVALALREAGEEAAAARAQQYLESRLGENSDAYAQAIGAYALAQAKSGRATSAREQLVGLAKETPEGLAWEPRAVAASGGAGRDGGAANETTGYAALALLQGGAAAVAGRAVRWLAGQRNSRGGFGSTQDTIVALQALTAAAAGSRAEVDATVTIAGEGWQKEVRIRPENADVLQVVEMPELASVTITARGKGEITAQAVRRCNLPKPEAPADGAFQLSIAHGAAEMAVDDLVTITATTRFTPPLAAAAGMVALEVALPTGLAAEADALTALAQREKRLRRWDLAGRKVILYIEDMQPNQEISLRFQARALYPVRAQSVVSRVFAYYRPEWRGEAAGPSVVINRR